MKFLTHFQVMGQKLFFSSLLLLVPICHATDLTVRIQVISSPPCIISGFDTININVDFGSIMISDIDGERYKMPINYYITCTNQTQQKLKMRFIGPTSEFDSQLLKTTANGLGIKLLSDYKQISLNEWTNFTYDPTMPDVTPKLYAVPVSSSTVKLTPGQFSAIATLELLYQ